jgi:FkbM family methyltransferase
MDFLLTRIPLLALWPKFAVVDGVRVPIRDSPLSPGTRRHLMRGGYETAERQLVAQLLHKGDQVLELGASIGIVSSILWKKAGPWGRVLSVEANPALRPHFERQMAANDLHGEWVEALCCPVWGELIPDSVRMQGFLASRDNLAGAAGDIPAKGEPGSTWRTAEAICSQYRIEPTAMVIDLEGSEAVWCTVAPGFPQSVRTIIVEVHPRLIGAARAGACVQAVIEEGFRIVAIYGTVFGLRRC